MPVLSLFFFLLAIVMLPATSCLVSLLFVLSVCKQMAMDQDTCRLPLHFCNLWSRLKSHHAPCTRPEAKNRFLPFRSAPPPISSERRCQPTPLLESLLLPGNGICFPCPAKSFLLHPAGSYPSCRLRLPGAAVRFRARARRRDGNAGPGPGRRRCRRRARGTLSPPLPPVCRGVVVVVPVPAGAPETSLLGRPD